MLLIRCRLCGCVLFESTRRALWRFNKFSSLSTSTFLKRNFYEVLGVDRNASSKQIKDAYFKLSKELHPDRQSAGNSHNKFVEINEAYQTLSKTSLRSQYDLTLDGKRTAYDYKAYQQYYDNRYQHPRTRTYQQTRNPFDTDWQQYYWQQQQRAQQQSHWGPFGSRKRYDEWMKQSGQDQGDAYRRWSEFEQRRAKHSSNTISMYFCLIALSYLVLVVLPNICTPKTTGFNWGHLFAMLFLSFFTFSIFLPLLKHNKRWSTHIKYNVNLENFCAMVLGGWLILVIFFITAPSWQQKQYQEEFWGRQRRQTPEQRRQTVQFMRLIQSMFYLWLGLTLFSVLVRAIMYHKRTAIDDARQRELREYYNRTIIESEQKRRRERMEKDARIREIIEPIAPDTQKDGDWLSKTQPFKPAGYS